MKAIVAVDKKWGIGYEGKLLERIPEDMRFFKQTTIGKIVVMGRTTFESLPGQQPLKDRVNIVLSASKDFGHSGIAVCRSLEELFEITSRYAAEDIFVAGGARVYSELLPYCTEAYVTKFENAHPADAYFPNLDCSEGWEPVILSESMQHNDLRYSRIKYVNNRIK